MKYWDEFYSSNKAPEQPTPFFNYIKEMFSGKKIKILEIGCGNGRDSFGFLEAGYELLAIDSSASAINFCTIKKIR